MVRLLFYTISYKYSITGGSLKFIPIQIIESSTMSRSYWIHTVGRDKGVYNAPHLNSICSPQTEKW